MVTPAGDKGHLNYGRALRLSAMKFRDHVALEFRGARYTFGELNRQVNAMAHALSAHGVRSGDRVLILSGNSPDYIRLLFAAAKLGAVCVPTSTALTESDLIFVLRAARPSLVVAGEAYLDLARRAVRGAALTDEPAIVGLPVDSAVPVDSAGPATWPEWLDVGAHPVIEPVVELPPDDAPAILLFTSGSMGTPKAVVKSFANLTWHAINRQLAEPRRERERELFVLPLTGVGFGNFVVTDVIVGATCVLEPSFDPSRTARLLAQGAISHAFLAPTMLMAVEATGDHLRFPGVSVIETAYEITPAQRARVARMFPDARILYSYGCTEGSMGRAPAEAFLADPTCVGFASGLDEYRVVGPAEDHRGPDSLGPIEVAGPTVMRGYLTASGELSRDVRDGWFDTGDLGWIDDAEALHFGGRQKDMIKSGGMNVYAWDVESALAAYPEIESVAVIGLPDDYWGEAVVAVIQPKDGARLELAQVRRHAEANLPGFRRPKAYFVTGRLPLNATGKLAKGELRQQVLAGAIRRLDGEPASTGDRET
jgi:fatty-acyl-CoA synthase